MFKNCKKIMTVAEMENQISDPGALQPGTLVIIRVKPVKGGEKA